MTQQLQSSRTPLRGAAAAAVGAMGDRVRLCDLYDEHGSAIYDDTGAADSSEIRELVRVVRPRKGPVLELAAGSGRLTLPLLALGRQVTALELSPHMLARLDAAVTDHRRERLELVQADMADFDLGETFPTIVLGASSITLLEPSRRPGLYACVRRHLERDGRWFCSLAEPLVSEGHGCDETHHLVGASGATYQLHQFWEPGDAHRSICVHPVDTGQCQVTVCVSTPRLVSRRELDTELESAGLRVVDEHRIADRGGVVRDVLLEVAT